MGFDFRAAEWQLSRITAGTHHDKAWQEQIKYFVQSGLACSKEDILSAFRAARAADGLPPELTFYWIAIILLSRGETRAEQMPRYRGLMARTDRIRRAHGLLAEEDFPEGETPAEIEAIDDELDRLTDAEVLDEMRSNGEAEMADLYENYHYEYLRRCGEGCCLTFDPEGPLERFRT